MLRWQLWLGVVLGGYVLVREALNRNWEWVVFVVVLVGLHVYREMTRPLPPRQPPGTGSER